VGVHALFFSGALSDACSRPPTQISRWRLQTWLGSAINGLIYGVGGIILFVPGSLSSQFLLLIVEFGMGSGAVFASASSLPSFLLYFYPAMFPLDLAVLRCRRHRSRHIGRLDADVHCGDHSFRHWHLPEHPQRR